MEQSSEGDLYFGGVKNAGYHQLSLKTHASIITFLRRY
jgi:hypothetical protein